MFDAFENFFFLTLHFSYWLVSSNVCLLVYFIWFKIFESCFIARISGIPWCLIWWEVFTCAPLLLYLTLAIALRTLWFVCFTISIVTLNCQEDEDWSILFCFQWHTFTRNNLFYNMEPCTWKFSRHNMSREESTKSICPVSYMTILLLLNIWI